MKKILFYLLLIVLIQCASQGIPPGGPVDKIPPEIVATQLEPPSGATDVPLDAPVKIVFSEGVERQSVEDAFFISPYPAGGVEFHWKRKRLKLEFPGGLEENRTYVITIGADTRDFRRNRMTESFTFAFATGDSLDQAEIKGLVSGSGAVEGTQIWAYSLHDSTAPNPELTEANYITQCSETGAYRLPYLSPESYRLFAIIDKDLNRIYDAEYDQIGVCTKDAQLSPDQLLVMECNFQLTTQDTTRPGLYKVYVPDNRHLALRFDESIDSLHTDSVKYVLIQQIEDGKPVDTLKIIQMYHNPREKARLELITEPQVAEAAYLISVSAFYDLWHNPVEEKYSTIDFIGEAAPDTNQPHLMLFTPPDSSLQVPLNQQLEFLFSELIVDSSLFSHVTIHDTLGETAAGKFQRTGHCQYKFIPDKNWTSLMPYIVEFQADSIYDLFGNALSDSIFTRLFTVLNKDTLSSIAGMIIDACKTDSGKIFLTAKQTKQREEKEYRITVDQPGPYLFEGILPGHYVISGFRDRDGNDEYSHGSIIPWLPAERFFFYADTIYARSRWQNDEENEIVIPK